MAWSNTYDTNTPANSDDPSEADDRMREIKAALQERLNVTLYFPLTGTEVSDTDAGEVRKIPFHEPISTPTAVANKSFLYGKDANSKIELFYLDEDNNEIQITSAGAILLDNGRLTNNTFLKALNAAGSGTVDLIKADANDVTVINDGTQLETDTAPSDDKGVVNKKYVDDQVSAKAQGLYTTEDDDSQTLAVSHAYLANQDGTVYVMCNASSGSAMTANGYEGDTDDPEGAGTLIQRMKRSYVIAGDDMSFNFEVKSGRYWEVTVGGCTATILWKPSHGTLVKCTDQD